MATPRVLGQLLRLTANLCLAREASVDTRLVTHWIRRLGGKRTQERLVGTATTGNNTNHTTGVGVDDLLSTGGELDAGLALIVVVSDNGDVVAGGAAQSSAVANLLLDIGNDGTLGHLTHGENVADGESSTLTGVDELTGVHALVGDEGLGDLLVLVGVAEDDLGERSTTTYNQAPNLMLALSPSDSP